MKLIEFLGRQSAFTLASVALALVGAIGFVDYATGPHLALVIFYLVPICLFSWLRGRWWGVAIAAASAVAWCMAEQLDETSGYRGWLLLWNTATRGGVFLVSAVLTAEVVQRKRVEGVLRQQTRILQSILNSMGDGVIVADVHGKIILSNPAAERLLRHGDGKQHLEQWLRRQETYLLDTLTGSPTNEHPLIRAIRGEVVDNAEMFLRHPESNDGVWLSTTGRPLIDEQARPNGGVIVFSDITFRKLMEKQIAEISDREQRRIGQDLHDNLCQHLVSTAFAAEVLREKLVRLGVAESAQAEVIAEMVNDAITQARQFARGLYPVRLEVDGLASALEELAANVEARSKIRCRFACDEPVLIYDEAAGSNLFRIAQEAVNNATRHACAKSISIGLGAVEDEITLTIKDDGKGFPPQLPKNGSMGLHIMNYRARMIGAALDIRRGVGGGTIVICSFHNKNLVKNELDD